MKLYLLKRRLPAGQACGLDEADGFVVRAVDAYDARRYAADWCGDEGRVVWLDEKFSTCTRLHVQGSEGAILRDFHGAG